MPNRPTSKCFSSTPLKTSQERDHHSSNVLDCGVLSDDEDTFSLLSPIYHESFDSDEDLEPSPAQQTSLRQSSDSSGSPSPSSMRILSIDGCSVFVVKLMDAVRLPLSDTVEKGERKDLSNIEKSTEFHVVLDKCELPKMPSERMLDTAVQPTGSHTLSAWENWLLKKAKEDFIKLKKQAEEEQILLAKKEKHEMECEKKKFVMDEKIQDWLKMKREQEKHRLLNRRKEEDDTQRQLEKQKEIEKKAQQKYKNWLQKKNKEKIEAKKKEEEEAALKVEQEKERQKRAEEKFNDWLAKANEKSRASPTSPCYPTSPYNKSYPSPNFFNPIPWKPIHNPLPERTPNKTSDKKPQRREKCSSATYRRINFSRAEQLLQKR